jgi:putative NADH-flavin reductase
MNLVIFGATGGTGRELVRQALEQEHRVTAVARNPAAITLEHENLRVVKGDVLDYASVEAAIRGQDAVLSALGTRVLKKNSILSDGTRNIIRAMGSTGVKRFVCESSLGVGDSRGQLGFLYNYLILPLFLRNIFVDKEVQEQYIKESGLEWVIVRPGALTNGPKTGRYRSGFGVTDKTIQGKISRADVADFMLKQVKDDRYLRQTPGVSY